MKISIAKIKQCYHYLNLQEAYDTGKMTCFKCNSVFVTPVLYKPNAIGIDYSNVSKNIAEELLDD